MGLWKKIFGEPEREERAMEPIVERKRGKTFSQKVEVKHVLTKNKDSAEGTLYLRMNKYTYFVTPKRSLLAKNLRLKKGDKVMLTVEKF